ncbi:MAG: cupin domain-containing protein [Gemmatimonadetes bacterium]|nr:cupin domain-containing protein [Gemmatimonadota bacterium]
MSSRDGQAGARVFRFHGFEWEGVEARVYKEGGEAFRGVIRRVLAKDDALAFEVRYFELEPGGYTSFERHEHEHVVIVLRGRGSVRLGEEMQALGFGDLVCVTPNTPHRFTNTDPAEPFGFLCIVDRERDRPVTLD